MIGSYAALAGTSLCYGSGTILQETAAKDTPGEGDVAIGLVARMLRHPGYLAGLFIDGIGFLLAFASLHVLPLFVVQLAIASSVGVTAVLSIALRREHASTRTVALVAMILGGLALAAWGAHPSTATSPGTATKIAVIGGAVALAFIFFATRRRTVSTVQLGILAGLGYGGCSFAVRAGHLPLNPLALITNSLAWAAGLYGALGILAFVALLQRTTATSAAASVTVSQTVVPAVLGVALLGDHVVPGTLPITVLGFVVATVGTVVLVRRPGQSHGQREGLAPIPLAGLDDLIDYEVVLDDSEDVRADP